MIKGIVTPKSDKIVKEQWLKPSCFAYTSVVREKIKIKMLAGLQKEGSRSGIN